MPTHFTYLKHVVIINGNEDYSCANRNFLYLLPYIQFELLLL